MSAAELMRNPIDAEWNRENPALAARFVRFDVRSAFGEAQKDVGNEN